MAKKQTENSAPSAVNNDEVIIESLSVTITTIETNIVLPSSEQDEAPAATNVLKTRH